MTEFLENPWVQRLGFVLGGFVLGLLLELVIIRRAHKLAERTRFKWDEMIIGSLRGVGTIWLVAGGVYLALNVGTPGPLLVSTTGIILLACIIFFDFKEVREQVREASGFDAAVTASFEKAEFGRSTSFIGYLIGILVASIVVGQLIALPAFVAIYLWRWGNYNWKICLSYAAVAWTFIYGFYDQVMHLFFYPSMLFG